MYWIHVWPTNTTAIQMGLVILLHTLGGICILLGIKHGLQTRFAYPLSNESMWRAVETRQDRVTIIDE